MSCSSEFDRKLSSVNNMITTRPDSALLIFNTINTNEAKTDNELGTYALVRMQVAEANGLPIPLDSLSILSSTTIVDIMNQTLAHYYLGRAMMSNGQYAQAIIQFHSTFPLIDEKDGIFEMAYPKTKGLIYCSLAEAYRQLGDEAEAKANFDKAIEYYDSYPTQELHYLVEEVKNMADDTTHIPPDSIGLKQISLNSAEILKEFATVIAEAPIARKRLMLTYIMSGLMIAFIVLMFSLFIFNRIRYQRNERKYDIAAINYYINLLQGAERKLVDSSHENAQLKNSMAELYATRYDIYNSLCDILMANTISSHQKAVIHDRLIRLVRSTGTSDDRVAKIEQEIDRFSKGLISRLRTEMPGLKEEEIRIFILIVIGFSPRTLGFILDLPIETIYNRKAYLKRKIKGSNAPSRDEFMSYL